MNLDDYAFVITSANDRDCLTLECTDESVRPPKLILEAALACYETKTATITQHDTDLPLELVEVFTKMVREEIERGSLGAAT